MVVRLEAIGNLDLPTGVRYDPLGGAISASGRFSGSLRGQRGFVGPRQVGISARDITDSIDRGFDEFGDELRRAIRSVTGGWRAENRPVVSFEKQIVGADRTVYAVNLADAPGGKGAQIWNWLDLGVKPHKIVARNATALRFRGFDYWQHGGGPFGRDTGLFNYIPGTTPGSLTWTGSAYRGDRTVIIPRPDQSQGSHLQPGPPLRYLPNKGGKPAVVQHPGIHPRGFSQAISARSIRVLSSGIEEIIRREHAI